MDNFTNLNETIETQNPMTDPVVEMNETVEEIKEPVAEIKEPVVTEKDKLKEMRKYYANPLWKLLICLVTIDVIQVILIVAFIIVLAIVQVLILKQPFNFVPYQGHFTYIALAISDLIGMVVFILLTLKNDKTKIHEYKRLSFGKWLWMLLCSYGVLGIGMIIGSITTKIVYLPFNVLEILINGQIANATLPFKGLFAAGGNSIGELMTMNRSWSFVFLGVLVVGILAPIVEEIIFRKLLIDNMSKYGIVASVTISAFLFGLFHGNLAQFFYAWALGIVFGFVYVYTGKIIYTILLHMSVNLVSSGIIVVVYNMVNVENTSKIADVFRLFTDGSISMEAYTQKIWSIMSADIFGSMIAPLLYLIIICAYYGFMFIGFIFLIVFIIKHVKNRNQLVKGVKKSGLAAFTNWAGILVMVFCGSMFVLTFLANAIGSLTALLS